MISEVTERRAAMRERIKQLSGEFLRRCSRDVMSMRGLLRRLGTGDADVCKELEHLAHRICGTGASLGFEALSTRAAAIERLAEGQSDIAATDQILMVRLVEYVAALEIEVDRLIQASV